VTKVQNSLPAPVPSSDLELGDPSLAPRLREAIEGTGGRQAVSQRSGVPVGTIANYLRGGEMKLSNTIALARATGVRLEWLVLGTGPMHENSMESGAMETGAELPATPAPGLFASVNMDILAAAYAAALAALQANGHTTPEPRRIVQVMALLYDQMAANGDFTASLLPLSSP
jgi:hypothetical protein